MNFSSLIAKYGLRVTGIIHVGAHFGEESQSYERHGVTRQMWFEPIRSNFAELQERCPKAELHQCALGSIPMMAEMYVESANQGESCSLLKPAHHLTQYPHIVFDKTETVRVRCLDDFVTDGYNMLVVDVQGYELEVFKGARHTLHKIDYILTEINKVQMYEGCALVEDIESYLGEFGFILSDVSWDGGTWGNGFFKKG